MSAATVWVGQLTLAALVPALDTQSIIAAGGEPFDTIMTVVAGLAEDSLPVDIRVV